MIREFLENTKEKNSRGLLVFDHEDPRKIVENLPEDNTILLVSDKENISKRNVDIIHYRKYIKVLGKEYDHVLIDLTGKYRHLRPSMLCSVAETIRAGGLLMIAIPDLYRTSLGLYGYRYDRYIKNSFRECENHLILHNNEIVSERRTDKKLEKKIDRLTEDQKKLINILQDFYEEPDKRLLAIRGGRGRGKTYMLGYLAYILHRRYNVPTIDLITEDLPKSFIEGIRAASGKNIEIFKRYLKVDRLTIRILTPSSRATSPIILIDEASRIGVSRIRRILARAYKVIITLTTYGYEGCGMFFKHYIDSLVSKYEGLSIDLKEPVRYCEGDPLERWINRVFVLEDESTTPDLSARDVSLDRLKLKIVNKDLLLRDIEYFRNIIKILRDAHYRHSPDDIEFILDSDDHLLIVCEHDGLPIAASHIRREHATRRDVKKASSGTVLKGLSTVTILSRYGTQSIYKLKIWRIHRIAVKVGLQRKGIGSFMLEKIEEIARESDVDVISALFSRNEVVQFWLRNGYVAFYISPRYNKVTGEHNIGVLKVLSDRSVDIVIPVLQDFKRRLILLSSSIYRELDSEIVAQILRRLNVRSPMKISISPLQERRLRLFLENFEKYDVEYVQDIVYLKLIEFLLNNEKINISDLDLTVLVCKFLQGKSIKDVAAAIDTCEDTARIIVKNVVKRFLAQIAISQTS